MITLGFALLHPAPEVLWAMTPRELMLALGRFRPVAAPLGRRTLEELIKACPDGDAHGGPDPQ